MVKFLDLFAGVGGFRLGMEQAGHNCVGYVEFDKYARLSYENMYDTKGEWTAHDITTVTDDDIRQLRNRGRIDCITGGFPCQAFSIAGQRQGFDDTRGTLFFEIARFASIIRPSYLFLENVKGLLNHDNGNTFETILGALDELGYDVEWDVLNTKDFSTREHPTPQNRERVFIIGHLRGRGTRKVFPVTRKDRTAYQNNIKPINDSKKTRELLKFDSANRFYDIGGLSPTINTVGGGGLEPKVAIKENTKKGYVEARVGDGIRLDHPNGKTGRGRVQKQSSSTITTSGSVGVLENNFRIRKLTPLECFRLQGFPDELFYKAQEVNSDSQLYKQAGNSVTVNVIYEIAKQLS